jgi:hypothetical protein
VVSVKPEHKGDTVMFSVQMHMQCSDRFLEILPEEVEETELAVEDLVSQVLLQHFETVFVVNISVQFEPGELMGQQVCSIQIHVQCPAGVVPLQPHEVSNMELVLEDHISCALIELFGSVDVESVVVC